MRFVYIQVPGHGKMAVHMQLSSIFNYSQVVQIHPIFLFVPVEHFHHMFQQSEVGFIHYSGYRRADDTVTGNNDHHCKEKCNCAVEP